MLKRLLKSSPLIITLAATGLAVSLQATLPGSAKPERQSVSGNSSGALFSAANAGSGTAIESILGSYTLLNAPGNSLVGVYNGSGSGNGVLGYSAGGYGGVFESFGGTLATLYSQNYTAVGGPGLQGVSGGNGVVGQSSHSNGVVGTTAYASAGSGSFSGVLGEDLTNSTGPGGTLSNAGVSGTSINGSGMVASSANGTGMYINAGGEDALFVNAYGLNNNGVVVDESATNAYGVLAAVSGGSNAVAVRADDRSSTADSYALYATTQNGTAVHAESGAPGGSIASVPALDLVGTGSDTLLMLATDASNPTPINSAALFANGNMYLHGSLTTNATFSIVSRSDGRVSQAYTPQMATRTIEDVGEGEMVNGIGQVAIDPDLIASMDRSVRYMVFITPEGNSNGVYVSRKSVTGFTVRENNLGRATMPFSYRIVAKPFARSAERMHAVSSDTNRELTAFMTPHRIHDRALDAKHLRRARPPIMSARLGLIPRIRTKPIITVR